MVTTIATVTKRTMKQYINAKVQKYLITFHNQIWINIFVLCDGKNEYVKTSLWKDTPSEYLDFYFKMEDMPDYFEHFFRYVDRNSAISLSDNGMGYIIQGPCIKGKQILNLKFICKYDYELMLKRRTQFIYDLDLSKVIAQKYFRDIYDDIVVHI